MELGTFGAIMGFGMELEKQATAFYEATGPAEVWPDMARRAHIRLRRLERARRELVTEMILEPITGLDSDNYRVKVDPQTDVVALLRQALTLEETRARFYNDAAAKMPIREVVKLFQRLARENAQHVTQFKEGS